MLPVVHRPGGDHIGMSGKGQNRPPIAAAGPEVVHFTEGQPLHFKADGCQTFDHEVLAVAIIRGDGRLGNQLRSQF